MPISPHRYHNGDGPPTVPHPLSSQLPQQREPSDHPPIDESTTEVPVLRPADLAAGRSLWEPLPASPGEPPASPADAIEDRPAELVPPWVDLASPEPEPAAEPEPEAEAELVTEPEPEPELMAEPEPELMTEPEPMTEPAPEPDLAAEPEPETELDLAPAPEPEPTHLLEEDITEMPLATENLAGNVTGEPTDAPAGDLTGGPAAPVAPRRPGEVAEEPIAVWTEDAAAQLRAEWRELHVLFIDDPNAAVIGAKRLVTEAVHALSERLLAEQDGFDPMAEDDSPDTESMRIAMRRYREFLDRVLAL